MRRTPIGPIAHDCRHYRGDKPCVHNRLCTGCQHYVPYSHRICIIKLGALGDVIRTLCILPKLKELYPDAHITWISKPNGCRMIQDHPMIDRTLEFGPITAMVTAAEVFDTLICLDKEPEPCALANAITAPRKLGVGLSDAGTPVPINPQAIAYFQLGLSDQLKFHDNTKSYAHLVYNALGWRYESQRYDLPVTEHNRQVVGELLARSGWRKEAPTLGVNVGAGTVFANKMWPAGKTAALIEQLADRHRDLQFVLLGGPGERDAVDAIHARLCNSRPHAPVIDPGTDHSEPAFVALVDHCDALFCGDTMAMHVAVARRKRVVALFGPTCEQEIDLFDLGEKLVADVACGPCYRRTCDHQDACLHDVSVDDAAGAIARAMSLPTAVRTVPLRVAG